MSWLLFEQRGPVCMRPLHEEEAVEQPAQVGVAEQER
jgi:hypothetical protein